MLFAIKKPKHHIRRLLSPAALLAVIIFFVVFSNNITESNTSHSKDILERALSRSITQCYAIEGSYPPSIEYLVEHYGLSYDTEHYYIDYIYIGSNLRPDTTIIERE